MVLVYSVRILFLVLEFSSVVRLIIEIVVLIVYVFDVVLIDWVLSVVVWVLRFIWLMFGRSCRNCCRLVLESVLILVRLCRLFWVLDVWVDVLVCVFMLFFVVDCWMCCYVFIGVVVYWL